MTDVTSAVGNPLTIETVSGRLVDPSHPDPQSIVINDIAWGLSRISRFAGHTITSIPYNVAQHSIYCADLIRRMFTEVSSDALWMREAFADKLIAGNGVTVSPNRDSYFLLRESSSSPEQWVHTFAQYTPPKLCYGHQQHLVSVIGLKALLHDAHEAYTGDIPSPVKRIPEIRPFLKKIEAALDTAICEAFDIPINFDEVSQIIDFVDKLAQAIEAYQFMPSRGRGWSNLLTPSLTLLQEFPSPMAALPSYEQFVSHYQSLNYLKDDDAMF